MNRIKRDRGLYLARMREKDPCEHEWHTEIMMIEPSERTRQQHDMGMDYKGGRAAFKLRKCQKCKKIEYLDYKVERIGVIHEDSDSERVL